MLKASLQSVWARKVRLLMSTFAIVLGVAFVAGSLMFTDTLNRTFTSVMNGTVGDVVVRPTDEARGHRTAGADARVLPASVVDSARRAPGAKQVDGVISSANAYVLDRKGHVIGGQGAPAFGVNYHDAQAAGGTPGMHVVTGRAPRGPGEIALDPTTMQRGGYRIGDQVSLITSGNPPRYRGKLVGTVAYADGSMAGSTLAALDTKTAQQLFLDGKNAYSTLWISAKPGTSQATLRDQIKPSIPAGYEVVTGKQASDEAASAIKKGLSFITTFLLVFAGVALLVGSFIIVNTFNMLVMQRTKELALLRALGASARQIKRSIVVEASIVGLIGSVLGVAAGVLLARGIVALLSVVGASLQMGEMLIKPRTVVVALVVGLLVTILAAWLPARRAAAIAPVTAMRLDPVEPESRTTRRAIVGFSLLLLGGLLILVGLRPGMSVWVLSVGMLVALLGTIAATVVLARPVVTLVGLLTRRAGIVSQLSRDNALRNPRRTAATASALMVGLTLVSMMTVFGASASSSVDETIAKQFRGDFVVGGLPGQAMPPKIAEQIRRVDGVKTVSPVRQAQGKIGGKTSVIQGVDAAAYLQVERPQLSAGSVHLTGSSVVLSQETAKGLNAHPGSRVTVTVDGLHVKTLTVSGILDDDATTAVGALVAMPTFTQLGGANKDASLSVVRQPDANIADVKAGISKVVTDVPTISVKNQTEYASEQRAPIDQMLMLIYGLLGLAIIIAALGVLNTLALSVLERTREIGLLRAVGLSKRQLRSMVRIESVAITLVGAVLGVLLGVAFGVAFQRSQADAGVSVLAIPFGKLALFLVLALVIGLIASWWPARRAANLRILDAIAAE